MTLPVSCTFTTAVPAYSEVDIQLEVPEGVEGDWIVEGPLQDKVPVVIARKKSLAHVRAQFYWLGFHSDVKLWCESCEDCAWCKAPIPKRRAVVSALAIPCSW